MSRGLFVAILVLGLVVGGCGQLQDTTQSVAILHLQKANEAKDAEQRSQEFRQASLALEASQRVSLVLTIVGLGILLLAGFGASLKR